MISNRKISDLSPSPRACPREHGSVLVVSLLTLVGMLALALVTVGKVRRGLQSSTQSRDSTIALFAAESGVSAGMAFIAGSSSAPAYASAWINPNNVAPQSPLGISGNRIPAGQPGSVFSGATAMDFQVTLLNNSDDPGFATGDDTDGIVYLRSVGHGPGRSMVEVEVSVDASQSPIAVLQWRLIR